MIITYTHQKDSANTMHISNTTLCGSQPDDEENKTIACKRSTIKTHPYNSNNEDTVAVLQK